MSNEELWEKKNHENKENEENDMCQGGKVGRKFPHLTNSFDEDQIEIKKKIKEKRKRKRKWRKEKMRWGNKQRKRIRWIRIREEEKAKGKKKHKGEEKRNKQKREKKNGVPLFSKIYENRTVGFCRSKMQSRSTYRELRVRTKILEFRQTPRGREFPTWIIFNIKVI